MGGINDIQNTNDFEETKPLKDKIEVNHENNSLEKCRRLFKDVVNNMTVEPSMFLFAFTSMVTMLGSQNLSLDKACRVNLNLSDEICSALRLQDVKEQNKYEGETQKFFALAISLKTYFIASIPGLMSLFIGSWSDKTGKRKIFLIIAIAGQLILSINNIIHSYFLTKSDMITFAISEAIIESLSGSYCVYILASYSYISTITTKETRTFRMGVINFCNTVGSPIGGCVAGIILKKINYYGCFGLSLILSVLNLLYIIFYVKDATRGREHKKHDNRGVLYFLRTFFDFTLIKQIFIFVIKNGPKNRRIRFCALVLIMNTLYGPSFGELTVMYMSTRYRFSWDEVNYSLFQSYNSIVHTIGTIGSVTVFSKILQWDDSLIGIIATVSKIAGAIVFCFATNGNIFYLGPLVEMLSATSMLAARSIASKIVAQEELGKANSILGLMENITPLLYVPLYTKVYIVTMEVLPGTVFLVGASLMIPSIAVFSWMFYEHRKSLKKSKIREETESPLNS